MSDSVAQDGRSASDSNKLKSLLTALKRMVGVRDIASMSLSLPAHILEPMPNLEYWNYQDRADMFVSIGTFDDQLDRMLAAVRYAFTKEHRFARGKVCKPYNSMVGEHFRCHWDVTTPGVNAEGHIIPADSLDTAAPTPLPTHSGVGSYDGQHFRVAYLTEQVSQNPPVSYYYYTCPDAGLEMCGVDQLSARFTGTAVRVESGPRNKGIFLTLGPQVKARSAVGEQYHFSHPCGAIHGLLRGSFSPAVTDVATVTCTPAPGSKGKPMRAIIEYKENGWLGKAEHAIEGCIYQSEPGTAAATCTQLRNVPQDSIIFTLCGTWRGLVTWQRRGETQTHPLINMAELNACQRHVRPLEEQHPWESRRLWNKVTQALLRHEYSHASSEKHRIEHNHPDHLDQQSKKGDPFTPRFFETDDVDGRPRLTAEGRAAIAAELGKKPASERTAPAPRPGDGRPAEKHLPGVPAPRPAANGGAFVAPPPPPKDAAAAPKYVRGAPRESLVKPTAPALVPATRSSHSGALPAISDALPTVYTGSGLAYLDDEDDEFVDAIDTQS